MYENEIEKIIKCSVESDVADSGDIGGVYDVSSGIDESLSDGQSSGSDGSVSVSSGDSSFYSSDDSDYLSYSVSSGDSAGNDSSTLQDYSSYLDALQDEISEVNNLVLLIFLFLILRWTENKTSLALLGIRERKR